MSTKRTILLIDDDETMLIALSKKLDSAYALVTTSQPREAVRLAIEHEPDLILCDIEMPGHNGGAVAADMAGHPQTAAIPFIFLTSVVSPLQAHEMDETIDGKPCVAKGGPLPVLLRKIESALAPKPA
jgi:CheY-like chemotaxis protein